MINPATTFRAAADDLRNNGWVKRDWRNDTGKCLVRAVLDAAGIRGRGLPLELSRPLDAELSGQRRYDKIKQELKQQHPRWKERKLLKNAIIDWNDQRVTRKHQVVRLLDRVANRLELMQLFEQLAAAECEPEQLTTVAPFERELVAIG